MPCTLTTEEVSIVADALLLATQYRAIDAERLALGARIVYALAALREDASMTVRLRRAINRLALRPDGTPMRHVHPAADIIRDWDDLTLGRDSLYAVNPKRWGLPPRRGCRTHPGKPHPNCRKCSDPFSPITVSREDALRVLRMRYGFKNEALQEIVWVNSDDFAR